MGGRGRMFLEEVACILWDFVTILKIPVVVGTVVKKQKALR